MTVKYCECGCGTEIKEFRSDGILVLTEEDKKKPEQLLSKVRFFMDSEAILL